MNEKREMFNDRPVYTLSDIAKSIQSVISKNYTRSYYIKAEILKLNFYPHSGHCYPELVEKENNIIVSQLRAIIWKNQLTTINNRFLAITGEKIKDGISVLCLASVEYSLQYGLALYIQDIEPTYTLGEMLKNKLEVIAGLKKEGVFFDNKNKQLPLVPKRIAVISVETSKGYSDFMVTLEQNNWNYQFQCKLFPAILQGEKAITTICAQLDEIEKEKDNFDCVVIVRGGGGDAGLSCYDDYRLAHRVATFSLPVIAGIGHSTNESVTDMVAYICKITPTEVAYFLIQQFHNFAIQVDACQTTIITNALSYIHQNYHQIEQIENNRKLTATKLLSNQRYLLNAKAQIIPLIARQIFNSQKDNLTNFETKIQLLHPHNVLKRGYSITMLNDKVVTDKKQLKPEDTVVVQLANGKVSAIIK